jgi:hypothetical protein
MTPLKDSECPKVENIFGDQVPGRCYDCKVNDLEEVLLVSGGGTCYTENLQVIDSEGKKLAGDLLNNENDGDLLGSKIKVLSYKSKTFVEYGELLAEMRNNGIYFMCERKIKNVGLAPVEPATNPVCPKFQSGQVQMPPNMTVPEQGWELSHHLARRTGDKPDMVYDVDIRHDGKKNKIASYDTASMAGCGEDITGLDLVIDNQDKNGTLNSEAAELSIDDKDLLSKLHILNMGKNGSHWSIVNISGEDYILNSSEERSLYQYKDNDFKIICHQNANYEVSQIPYGDK